MREREREGERVREKERLRVRVRVRARASVWSWALRALLVLPQLALPRISERALLRLEASGNDPNAFQGASPRRHIMGQTEGMGGGGGGG